MPNCGQLCGVILCKLLGPLNKNRRTMLMRYLENLLIIATDGNGIKTIGSDGVSEGMRKKWNSVEPANVLSWYTL
jgi:hypothetical protein